MNAPRKRLGGRTNKRMTGIGVWKNPTRDHRFRLRGPRGRRRNLHLGKRKLRLGRLRVGICRQADFILVLLSPSPKREHFKVPFRIRRHEHFFSDRLVDTSHLRRLFHSHLLLFPTRFFRPFSPRFGVGGFTILLLLASSGQPSHLRSCPHLRNARDRC